jgi:hypothetical protein
MSASLAKESSSQLRELDLPALTELEEHIDPVSRFVGARHVDNIWGKCIHRFTVRPQSISVQMGCSEYLRLNQHYGAALRRWAQAESSSGKSEPFDAPRRLALEIEKKALDERNAAYERMVLHELSCPTCNHKRKPPRTERPH